MSRATRRALILVPVLLVILVALFFLLRPNSPAPEPSKEASTTSGSAENPQEKTFDLTVEQGVMTPAEMVVSEGDRVRFHISSDEPLELHVHGYDLEEEVEPGEPGELSFDATITGRFEIENHDTDTVLGVLLVQPR